MMNLSRVFLFFLLLTLCKASEFHTYSCSYTPCGELIGAAKNLGIKGRYTVIPNGQILYIGTEAEFQKFRGVLQGMDQKPVEITGFLRSQSNEKSQESSLRRRSAKVASSTQTQIRALSGQPFRIELGNQTVRELRDFLVVEERKFSLELVFFPTSNGAMVDLKITRPVQGEQTFVLQQKRLIPYSKWTELALHTGEDVEKFKEIGLERVGYLKLKKSISLGVSIFLNQP